MAEHGAYATEHGAMFLEAVGKGELVGGECPITQFQAAASGLTDKRGEDRHVSQ